MFKQVLPTLSGVLLVLGGSGGAIATPAPDRAPIPVTEDSPLCYLQIGQQVVNLSNLCGASTVQKRATPIVPALPDRLTASSQESGVQTADFTTLAATGKMWDVNTTSQRNR